jgi:hypothetical protein
MFFICGVVDKRTGLRNIFSGATHGKGTVRQIENFTPVGVRKDQLDWGEEAIFDAAARTAFLILSSVTNHTTARRLADDYAKDVVMKMEPGRMWLLFNGDIESWLQGKVKVA